MAVVGPLTNVEVEKLILSETAGTPIKPGKPVAHLTPGPQGTWHVTLWPSHDYLVERRSIELEEQAVRAESQSGAKTRNPTITVKLTPGDKAALKKIAARLKLKRARKGAGHSRLARLWFVEAQRQLASRLKEAA